MVVVAFDVQAYDFAVVYKKREWKSVLGCEVVRVCRSYNTRGNLLICTDVLPTPQIFVEGEVGKFESVKVVVQSCVFPRRAVVGSVHKRCLLGDVEKTEAVLISVVNAVRSVVILGIKQFACDTRAAVFVLCIPVFAVKRRVQRHRRGTCMTARFAVGVVVDCQEAVEADFAFAVETVEHFLSKHRARKYVKHLGRAERRVLDAGNFDYSRLVAADVDFGGNKTCLIHRHVLRTAFHAECNALRAALDICVKFGSLAGTYFRRAADGDFCRLDNRPGTCSVLDLCRSGRFLVAVRDCYYGNRNVLVERCQLVSCCSDGVLLTLSVENKHVALRICNRIPRNDAVFVNGNVLRNCQLFVLGVVVLTCGKRHKGKHHHAGK